MAENTTATKADDETEYDLRAFRLTLDPTPAQEADLRRHAGAARWAYNYALARQRPVDDEIQKHAGG